MAFPPSTTTSGLAVTAGTWISVADVAFESRTAGNEAMYSYRNKISAAPGDAVMVPLGPRTAIGYVVRTREVTPRQLGFETRHLKDIIAKVADVSLPEQILDLVEFLAEKTLSSVPTVLSLASPPGIRERVVTRFSLVTPAITPTEPLTQVQKETLRVLESNQGILSDSRTKPLTSSAKKALRSLTKIGLVREELELANSAERHRLTGSLRLSGDEARVETFIATLGKRKPAQASVLMRLQGAAETSFTPQEIKALTGTTDQTLMSLIHAGLLDRVEGDTFQQSNPPQLNPHQAEAASKITAAIREHRFEPFLLFGVTGSGKTEVYLRAAEEALRQGRSVLFLVPEIALTAQVISQLRTRFGHGVAVLHSNLPPGERLSNWMRIASGEAAVILGARSALFSPIQDLGLIILDEEHESSYKQESNPRYHTRDGALFLAQRFGCPVVLGSATPSVESFFAAEKGDITLLRLPERAASAQLPKVLIQDLTQLFKDRHPSIFSPLLKDRMTATLERGEQVILFLNRRAFSPFIVCRDCGQDFMCPSCSVSLSYHKKAGRLKCHHCGYETPAPDVCPNCSGTRVAPFGVGSEKVEEAVAAEFPGVKVGRLDRDIAQKRGALEETLAVFRSGGTQVLVGTQMVAKGLDFPNVTLVGVIAADISLNMPDYRASERTFQLLSQVAGRAGRGQKAGEVVIQTLNPSNVAIDRATHHDYEGFYRHILEERRDALYTPFCTLVNVVFAGENRNEVEAAADLVRKALREVPEGTHVLGPVNCPLERLNGLWRVHILLKLMDERDIGGLLPLLQNPNSKTVTLTVDVNPYSMQ